MNQEVSADLDSPIIPSANSERLQGLHYDRISSQYESHYGDRFSQEYRNRFINQPMFEGIELSGMDVLEAMCGNGQTAEFLLSRGARVTALDISTAQIDSFQQRWPNCESRCASILDSRFANESFDCIAIVGGLHHLHPHVDEAVREVHRILKPGGYFCFAEPHQGSIPDRVRAFWYKHDEMFASNEASIDLSALNEEFAASFSLKRERYLGNIGYLLVLNSMVFRIPLRLKPWYTPILLRTEALINRLQGKWSACFVICQWRKFEQSRTTR